ncbi:MAG TPA: LTA synthase family protein [Candidatus Rifleibacterium sp.]|nr:LTA synthase family protein [Candidatus Rifleibacterium sp.]
MEKFLGRIGAIWRDLKGPAVVVLLAIFSIRLFSVLINLRTHLGELWRPRIYEPEWGQALMALVFLPVILLLHRAFARLSTGIQNRYLVLHFLTWLSMVLFNNLSDRSTYLYHLFEGRIDGEILQSLLVMDTFFQAPGIFWGFCWLALSLWVAIKTGQRRWLPLLWALPFAGVTFYQNNLLLVFFSASAVAGICCHLLRPQTSAKKVYLFQGIAMALILVFLDQSPIIYRSSWLSAVLLLPVCWLPGYWFIRSCEADNSDSARAITWLVPLLAGTLLSQVLYNAPLGKSLFSFWFFIVSFNHAAPAIPLILAIIATAALAGRLAQWLMRPVFALGGIMAVLLYLIDGGLLYQNGMRLTYGALGWFFSQQSLAVILKTIGSVLDWKLAAVMLGLPFALRVLYLAVKAREKSEKQLLSGTVVYILVSAQLALIGYQLATDYPTLLVDSGRVFMASLPAPAFMRPEKLPTADLINGFATCRISVAPNTASASVSAPSSELKNIIIIMLESTSTRYLSLFGYPEKTWPQLERLSDRTEIFPFFFSCFPESASADFAVLSGLYAPDHIFLGNSGGFNHPTLIEKLSEAGYDCSMFLSGFIGDTGWKSLFQPRGFARLYDAVSLPGTSRSDGWVWGIKEHVAVERIGRLLREKAAAPEKPFLIYYRMVFPHSPFDRVTDDPAVFPEDDYYKGSWAGRFKNCLLYQDAQIAGLINQVEQCGLRDKTIFVIVGDHGTMLGENGLNGHGWNLAPELANVPLAIIRPQSSGFKINNQAGSQADLQPTILELAGVFNSRPSFVQGKSLLRARPASESIYLSSLIHKAVVEDGHYFLFPLEKSADAMVFRMNANTLNGRFSQLAAWPPDDLWARFRRMKKFFGLQGQFLNEIEYHDREYFRH